MRSKALVSDRACRRLRVSRSDRRFRARARPISTGSCGSGWSPVARTARNRRSTSSPALARRTRPRRLLQQRRDRPGSTEGSGVRLPGAGHRQGCGADIVSARCGCRLAQAKADLDEFVRIWSVASGGDCSRASCDAFFSYWHGALRQGRVLTTPRVGADREEAEGVRVPALVHDRGVTSNSCLAMPSPTRRGPGRPRRVRGEVDSVAEHAPTGTVAADMKLTDSDRRGRFAIPPGRSMTTSSSHIRSLTRRPHRPANSRCQRSASPSPATCFSMPRNTHQCFRRERRTAARRATHGRRSRGCAHALPVSQSVPPRRHSTRPGLRGSERDGLEIVSRFRRILPTESNLAGSTGTAGVRRCH